MAQGFLQEHDGEYVVADRAGWKMEVPMELVPYCEKCGRPMTMNLRGDDRFVEDERWKAASGRYADFLRRHGSGSVLFLELGVRMNTPGIIKYPFWRMTHQMPKAFYVCVNDKQAVAPKEIAGRALCIRKDIDTVLDGLLSAT